MRSTLRASPSASTPNRASRVSRRTPRSQQRLSELRSPLSRRRQTNGATADVEGKFDTDVEESPSKKQRVSVPVASSPVAKSTLRHVKSLLDEQMIDPAHLIELAQQYQSEGNTPPSTSTFRTTQTVLQISARINLLIHPRCTNPRAGRLAKTMVGGEAGKKT